MSKDCNTCNYYNGYDYTDGTPFCNYKDEVTGNVGFEYCPYNDTTKIVKKGINIEIDTRFMNDYITHTLVNTIKNEAYEIASKEVKSIISDEIKDALDRKIQMEMDKQISQMISNELQNFMDGTMEIGGGWNSPQQTVVRRQYLAEQIEQQLNSVDTRSIRRIAEEEISIFEEKLKREINQEIKQVFDNATRQTLTDNVVNMLMDNETYKTLSANMASLLPTNS